jgi:hypothetical protein
MHDRTYTNKIGHSFIICSCLSIITGLVIIIFGVISNVKKTTFIGIGVLSVGVGFIFITLLCFYAKLHICYNNWAYRSRIVPNTIETPHPATPGVISISPFVGSPGITQKSQCTTSLEPPTPLTIVSNVEIHNTDVT